jgi:hypothetical protein
MANYGDETTTASKPSKRAVELFKQALAREPIAAAADRRAPRNRATQTPERERFHELVKMLDRELGIKLWQISPFDVNRVRQPHDEFADWERATRLRAALLVGAGLDPD